MKVPTFMNVTKRQLPVIFLAVALTLAACGSPNSDAVSSNSAVNPETAETTDQSTGSTEKLGLWYTTDEAAGGIVTTPEAASIIFPKGAQYSGYRGEKARLENQLLPSGAMPGNDAAEAAPWRFEPYELYYIGSRNTNREFAEEIYRTFLSIPDEKKKNRQRFEVHSALNGRTFNITCKSDNPHYVTCEGGIGAVIYIV